MLTLFFLIFWFTLLLCFSSFGFYPLAIWALGRIAPFKVRRKNIAPTISIIISAYNEAKNIGRKIENTLALDYPKHKLEILVGSDGSTDETPIIVESFNYRGVQLLRFDKNRGKTAVQNDLVRRSKGDILIFTDAASFLQPDAIRKTVRNFADERVGCVAGRMHFLNTNSNITTQSQGLYWRYELKIRELESALGRLIGVDGPFYSVKRECYVPLEHNIISDLVTPLLVLEQGKRVVLESEIEVSEEPKHTPHQEFTTRRRITLRGLVGLAAHSHLLNPLRHPLLVLQLFFHKVLRWFVGPTFAINTLAACVLAGHWFFRSVLIVYSLIFLAAGLGWLADRMRMKASAFTVPYYFILANLAATAAIIDFIKRRQTITWETQRD